MSLEIVAHLADNIRSHGIRCYPYECCGLLLGKESEGGRRVTGMVQVENGAIESCGNRYRISPRDLLRAEDAAKSSGLDIIGIYHSHPDRNAYPSEHDKENALPWYSYVIVAVWEGDAAEMKSWRFRQDWSEFEREEIWITER